MNKKFAVFDIDGTVIRWQLYHAIFGALAKAGHISPERFEQVRAARMVWKRRAGESSFKDYERTLVNAYDEAIASIAPDDFLAAVNSVFEEYRDQTYSYTRDLIRALKKQGYLLFAISASQIEIVELFAHYYEFDDFGGSVYELKNGRFTGHKQVLMSERKPIRLRELAKKHNADFTGSLAVGDSASDIPMLETVASPIAFNPDKLLFDHAQKQGWKTVIERKNVIYRLNAKNGAYVLANPNG